MEPTTLRNIARKILEIEAHIEESKQVLADPHARPEDKHFHETALRYYSALKMRVLSSVAEGG